MEIKPYNVLKLSLTDIALRRVVVNLWNESDILSLIARIPFKSMSYKESTDAFREAVEDKVKDKLLKLVLPKLLEEKMMELIRPIGSELQGWKRYHEKYFSDLCEEFNVSILEKLFWTSAGTVNYKKTAEKLVLCDMVDIMNQYKLACLYCLEDYIPDFWEKLPERVKSTFYNKEYNLCGREPLLQFLWPYILKGEESNLDNMHKLNTFRNFTSIHQYAFENSASRGNKAATEYFFHRLTHREREDSLIRTADIVKNNRNIGYENSEDFPMEKHSEVLCYLISVMTPEQQMIAFGETSYLFLTCFLDWPFQDLFLEFARLVWTSLPVADYHFLIFFLNTAFMKLDYFFPKLLQKFFIHSPVDFKKYLVNGVSVSSRDISLFINKQDSESIKVILRNVDVDDRMKLISSYKFFTIFNDLMKEERWDLIELYLREATLSIEGRKRLKQIFLSSLTVVNEKWKRFFQLLEEINANAANKRSSEDEAMMKAKKTCCEDG